ncbi:glutathione S-transferase family protein [Sinimarinibacterium sp. NLF-5-8]|uniref:glutathione S-transferase family protein n=1 Tax=Sinimarinibacterium sp. NLF-5-8 TaxID=2698684 RepID=UPI00137BFA76|nr:glutathione S-transferase [Sinimarinibacterium sp. NLF-5-8]QHS10461.1 glutathione S-transferase [Sinimarinibacterium sp. NLF-5-8]
MLTVHHLETSRSQRILWLLEELGVPYTLRRYARDPKTRLAPAELKKVHPLGKSPVITDGDVVVAESGAIIEYLAERFGAELPAELAMLDPARGSAAHQQCRFWMHYAEGSLMNWLVMKLVFGMIPRQPMPLIVRPVARAICDKVQQQLIAPNIDTALDFIESHLAQNRWFAGEMLTMADFQMSFAVEAALASGNRPYPHLQAWRQRVNARPAYQRALDKGGPVLAGLAAEAS